MSCVIWRGFVSTFCNILAYRRRGKEKFSILGEEASVSCGTFLSLIFGTDDWDVVCRVLMNELKNTYFWGGGCCGTSGLVCPLEIFLNSVECYSIICINGTRSTSANYTRMLRLALHAAQQRFT